MRIEREGLEHHRNAAPLDGRAGDVHAPRCGSSRCPADESGDGSQGRGLADGARPEQNEEASLRDVEGETVKRAHVAVGFRDPRETQCWSVASCHSHSLFSGPVGSSWSETRSVSDDLQDAFQCLQHLWHDRLLPKLHASLASALGVHPLPRRADLSTASVTDRWPAHRGRSARPACRSSGRRGSRRPGARRCARSRSAGPAPTSCPCRDGRRR